MTGIIPLKPKITNAGLGAVFNETNNGLEAWISHVAFGDGAGNSYAPTGTETQLKREKVRVAIGGGGREAPTQILVQGVLDEGPEFWVREVGFFLNDGTLLAVWSEPGTLLIHKTDGVPFVFAYGLALKGVPANSVNVQISGPAVNVVFDKEFALIAANQARFALRQFRLWEAYNEAYGTYPGE